MRAYQQTGLAEELLARLQASGRAPRPGERMVRCDRTQNRPRLRVDQVWVRSHAHDAVDMISVVFENGQLASAVVGSRSYWTANRDNPCRFDFDPSDKGGAA